MAKKVVKKKAKKVSYKHSKHHHHASNDLLLVIAGGFLVLVVLMYLVASSNFMNQTAAVSTTEANEEVTVSRTIVTIDSGLFSPSTVRVKKGQSVTFVNNDAETHTATALDESFTTQNLALDTSETLTFDTPGVFEYQCNFHPEMRGTVIVEE